MKSTVHYDANGDILSVVQVDSRASIVPLIAQHLSLDVDLKGTQADTLAEMHSNFRVILLVARSSGARQKTSACKSETLRR